MKGLLMSARRTGRLPLAGVVIALAALCSAAPAAFAQTNDFSISASPSTVTVESGAIGTSTISTAVASGMAQSVELSVSGVPAGASATLNPTSVTAGASSTLTLNSGTAAAGEYSVTVSGTEGTATHSTTVTFTINQTLPTSKGQCKNGGWKGFGSTFKNQGQCVSFVEQQQHAVRHHRRHH